MDANLILSKTKKAMQDASYDMVPTVKNRNSRRKYGLSLYDIEDFLSKLEVADLIQGPIVDRDYPNEELFIFKKEIIPNVIFYVKIKEKDNQIKILSCHEDEN
ncbi:MAG: hypothetical protein PHS45_05015 [Bacilli bacterium]|nr:hypothetical protein [Bacilli bacterium]